MITVIVIVWYCLCNIMLSVSSYRYMYNDLCIILYNSPLTIISHKGTIIFSHTCRHIDVRKAHTHTFCTLVMFFSPTWSSQISSTWIAPGLRMAATATTTHTHTYSWQSKLLAPWMHRTPDCGSTFLQRIPSSYQVKTSMLLQLLLPSMPPMPPPMPPTRSKQLWWKREQLRRLGWGNILRAATDPRGSAQDELISCNKWRRVHISYGITVIWIDGKWCTSKKCWFAIPKTQPLRVKTEHLKIELTEWYLWRMDVHLRDFFDIHSWRFVDQVAHLKPYPWHTSHVFCLRKMQLFLGGMEMTICLRGEWRWRWLKDLQDQSLPAGWRDRKGGSPWVFAETELAVSQVITGYPQIIHVK